MNTIQLTVKLKLLPTEQQRVLLRETMREYISLINDVLDYAIAIDELPRLTSATVHAALPSVLRAQCCRDIRSIYAKAKKHRGCKFPVLRKPVAIWNNQNYEILDGCIHKAEGRSYACPHCGYRGHRDRVGAVNILAA